MKSVWNVLKLGIALLRLLLTGARSSLAEGCKARKRLQQPIGQALVEAGEEGEAGKYQQAAHDLLDRAEIPGESPQEDHETVDAKRRQEEWNPKSRRIDRQQDSTFADALLARRDRQDGGEHRADTGGPAECECK